MGHQDHEAYTGDRTKEALVGFADALVPSAGEVSPFMIKSRHASSAASDYSS